jgi:hypothetical protein
VSETIERKKTLQEGENKRDFFDTVKEAPIFVRCYFSCLPRGPYVDTLTRLSGLSTYLVISSHPFLLFENLQTKSINKILKKI